MRIAALFLTLMISACGWQLRGSGTELAMEAVSVDGTSMELRQSLRSYLRAADVLVHDQAPSVINVLNESWQSRVVAVDSAGRALENEWRYDLKWQYQDRDGEPLAPVRELNLTGTATLNPNDALGSGDENTRTQEQLRDDAARLIIQQLRFLEAAP